PGTISLGQGVVHYPPPPSAAEGVAQFLNAGSHHYCPVGGMPELVELLEAKLKKENGIEVHPACRVVVTAGGNMAFLNAILAVCDPGDEVIILSPYYFNHEMAIAIASLKAVVVPTTAEFQPDLQRIEKAITPRTRVMVTISPNNPTGAVYPEASLRRVNALCARHGIYHIHDEAYEYFVYEGARHFSPASIDGAAGHTISLFSLSKSYGFASWRIGYMVIPQDLHTAVQKIQDTNLICPPVISQHAAIRILQDGPEYCHEKVREIAKVRRVVLNHLAELGELITVPKADGAMYFLVKVHSNQKDMDLVTALVKDFRVAVIPGHTFGMDGGCYLRISYGALERSAVAEGISRFVRGIRQLVGERA
ncbi:MAG TPA: pyridoxal phosphate-dependent aminotransferase, partial [Tepidisphaeraceae bacterium]